MKLMLKVFFSNFMRRKQKMPLVHELKFGAINQLSGIYLYKCIYLRKVFTLKVDCIL